MPIIINNIPSALDADKAEIVAAALKAAGLSGNSVKSAGIYKTSLDARKRSDIHFVHSVYAELYSPDEEAALCARCPAVNLAAQCRVDAVIGENKQSGRVCVVGFGPAGMFCSLLLAEHGYKPLVLERGSDVDSRVKAVADYWQGGTLDTHSNVQFGEGGAGTFSDGKLTTRIKDPLCRYVLERFVSFGAPADILTKAKPHIGTDKLRSVVRALREKMISLGGEIRFNTQFDDFTSDGRRITAVCAGEERTECSALVLAAGHSARDTFEMLARRNVFLEAKPFSVGVRIEHKQQAVNDSLYGQYASNPLLPQGEYQLSAKSREGRGVYTFCMCPGGTVVPAASENETVVTNGMSEYSRSGENANAAVAVSVYPADFGTAPLDGMYFARDIERKAYRLAGDGRAPALSVKGLLEDRLLLSDTVAPTYARGVKACSFNDIFPEFVNEHLKFGIRDFSRKMKCFGDGGAMLTAPETRTSSPVRITRGEKLNSLSFDNLFPCGEGAGYAGGIMSAAVDGLRVALEIMSRQAP
ncbi:MAG: NAD(P)/FAD-dependent oxidoreductase [Ruminococcus sp.]|nr:NAD(P)/FAD-dependent oxidoreductase [Ruminococcus sp.]